MKIRKHSQKVSERVSSVERPYVKTSKGAKFVREVALETETEGRSALREALSCGVTCPGDQSIAHTSPQERPLQPVHNSSEFAKLEAQPQSMNGSIVANVNQTKCLDVSDSGSYGDWTQRDHNPTRKYARRSLRNAGVGAVQSGKGLCNGDAHANSRVAKEIQQSCKPIRAEARCQQDELVHPSQELEGSMLHCLYLQLLAVGREGMTLKEMFASFESQTRLPRFARNWRDQVKSHLQSSPYFKNVKGRYFLCEQSEQAPKVMKSGVNGVMANLFNVIGERKSSCDLTISDVKSKQADGATNLLGVVPSVVIDRREGVQTRRKTYERTVDAVLTESVMEFNRIRKFEDISDDPSTGLSTESRALDQQKPVVKHSEPPTVRGSKKKKTLAHIGGELLPKNIRLGGAVPGSLREMQARIVAESGVQSGVRCSRKDGSNNSSKWQCPMMAMEGRSLCEHHNFLSERKKARYKKAKRQGFVTRNQSPKKELKRDSVTKTCLIDGLQDVSKPTRTSRDDAEANDDINLLATQALESKGGSCPVDDVKTDEHTNASLAERNNTHSTEDIHSETEVGLSQGNSVPGETARQSLRSTRKPRNYVAAKKTAEDILVLVAAKGKATQKPSVPLIRPPSIPPLPMLYGVRRKSSRNRSL